MAKILLTDRQEAFCQEFAKTRSPGKAYRAAYECGDDVNAEKANKAGRGVMKSAAVMDRIEDLIDAATATVVFTVGEALGRWLAIATADPNELISLKVGACRYCHGDGHEYQWTEREYGDALAEAERLAAMSRDGDAQLPPLKGGFGYDGSAEPHPACPECHGDGVHRIVVRDTEALSPGGKLLYGGVKHTAHGPQVIIADRMKALENACRIIGAFKDTVNVPQLGRMAAVLALETTDPNEAAKAYQELIAGMSGPTQH